MLLATRWVILFLPATLIPTLTSLTPVQWKVMVVDEQSRKLINSVVKEEEILNLNVSSELTLGPCLPPNGLLKTVTPQMSNKSSTDDRPTRTWTQYISYLPNHGLWIV